MIPDSVTAGLASLYLPYNGFQAGFKPASTDVTMGRAEGRSPFVFLMIPHEWGIKGG
jgi:hypothetical protein